MCLREKHLHHRIGSFWRAALSARPSSLCQWAAAAAAFASSSSENKRHRQAVSIGSEQRVKFGAARWSVKNESTESASPSLPLSRSSTHRRLGHRATRWCACLYNRARSEPKAKKHPTSFFPPPSPPESKSPGHCSPLAGRPSVVMRRAAQLHTRSLRLPPAERARRGEWAAGLARLWPCACALLKQPSFLT